jgi:FMN phosphatase YigB (HAD superfamily)
MFKDILFDLDGTLLDRDTSVKEFAAAQYDRLALHLNYISSIYFKEPKDADAITDELNEILLVLKHWERV